MKIYPHQCKQQQQDIEQILNSAEEVISMALSLSSQGSMGYPLFIQARDNFRQLVKQTSNKYRIVIEEDNTGE